MDLDGNGAKQYRVLSMNGDVAKVMAMYDTLKGAYNSTNTTTTMGTLTVQKYEGSTIDTYLNTTWYNTLTSATKAAIVPETVICDAWYWSSSTASGDPVYSGTYGSSVPGTANYSIGKYAGGTLNIGERNIFVLGVQDVIDYLNDSSVQVDTTAILRNVNIWKMFWNRNGPIDTYPWLRSASAKDSTNAWRVDGYTAYLVGNSVYQSFVIRPTLNLDLSKIQYTVDPPVTEGETWVINENITALFLSPVSINFVSNSTNFTTISSIREGDSAQIKYDDTIVGEAELLSDLEIMHTLLIGLTRPTAPSPSPLRLLVTYSLGFSPTQSNNKTSNSLRAVYFSTNFCNKLTSFYYKITTNSSTNLACAQSEPNNRLKQ